ncbi:cytochrome c biogenesis protein ResB [Hamadaea tsunoensis]|uniref:cytochrome c biogenesis protein ResB n=1 Tax=Hamadaea tsunoensis TaxID=53368 RepID=UPI00040EBAD0|nr:cytochrome c biogenesis protein ResB [Hamadaea tsunoensis]
MKPLLTFASVKLRNGWRQLTSMRTALVLLFLLALAAIPGSVFPQQNIKPEAVTRYLTDHPKLGPVVARLYGFEVFSSPWFAAIYLLLFTSLVGCILPRSRDHARALLRRVPDAPKRLERLPAHHRGRTTLGAAEVTARLRGWRTVTREQADGSVTVAAERGFLKESGNLVFHTSLIVVLIGVALGSMGGWHANRILVQGEEQAFCDTVQQFDDYSLGTAVGAGDLPPFCLELTGFDSKYLETGEPSAFAGYLSVTGSETRTGSFSVNHPLRLKDANVYLLGHGYAPILRYTNAQGKQQTTVAPFLPTDNSTLTSEGVATFPDANGDRKKQVAFSGLYIPTAPETGMIAQSIFPAERNPRLMLTFYRGDLGIDEGTPSSVYKLNQVNIARGDLKQVGEGKVLKVGDSWTLDDGSKLEFLGTRPWVALSLRHDPGEPVVLGGVAFVLIGLMLSLAGKRRRVWVRLTPDGTGSSLLEAGGLARSDYPGFDDEFRALMDRIGDSDREPVDALR